MWETAGAAGVTSAADSSPSSNERVPHRFPLQRVTARQKTTRYLPAFGFIFIIIIIIIHLQTFKQPKACAGLLHIRITFYSILVGLSGNNTFQIKDARGDTSRVWLNKKIKRRV